MDVKEIKLLERVVSYYQHTLSEDTDGLEYVKSKGVSDNQTIKDFGIGYVNATLCDILPDDESIISTLKKVGILNSREKEVFAGCLVFPVWNNQHEIINLYGVDIHDEDASGKFVSSEEGVINQRALTRPDSAILVDSIFDALLLYDQGFYNVVPVLGENQLSIITAKATDIYLTYKPTEAFKEELQDTGVQSYFITLPDRDLTTYFDRHTPEEFEKLIRETNPSSIEQSDKVQKRTRTLFEEQEHGFLVGYGDRQYQIKGVQRGETQLKTTIKVSIDVNDTGLPFELTTIDLYSSRSRQWFARLCSDMLGCTEELVKEDLAKILILIEEWSCKKKDQSRTTEPTKEEKKQAEAFLNNPDLLGELLSDFEILGVTGEENNKIVGYLSATSRLLADPLSTLIQSRSSAGKSTVQDAVLSLIPPEDYIKYTRVTDQALFYKDEDSLVHKILAIEEAEGMGGSAYSIRTIQSAKEITVATTGKDSSTGKMRTEEYKVKGPTSIMITTTATEIDQETASRFIFLTIDESIEMTKSIHNMQREAETLEGMKLSARKESVIKKHHTAQRMLKSLAIVNPYSMYLSYPSHSLRARRDHQKYLGLIRAVAFLSQCQREVNTIEVDGNPVEFIEVTLADIEIANKLAERVLGQAMDELAKPSKTLLSSITKMIREISVADDTDLSEVVFTRKMLREYTNWSDWQVKTHIKQLVDMEYINVKRGSHGREYSYALGHLEQPEEHETQLNLTSINEISKLAEADSFNNLVAT